MFLQRLGHFSPSTVTMPLCSQARANGLPRHSFVGQFHFRDGGKSSLHHQRGCQLCPDDRAPSLNTQYANPDAPHPNAIPRLVRRLPQSKIKRIFLLMSLWVCRLRQWSSRQSPLGRETGAAPALAPACKSSNLRPESLPYSQTSAPRSKHPRRWVGIAFVPTRTSRLIPSRV